eukprot:TRINITY_DN2845_c1_g1_i1.p1 TRINITY_DN2845_c1_g1~~TRINITY_DN2845_c1_g1_i1.p1  ORF type:complete len:303 (+),score=78.66 TRINITY_DN2845_c1_g1_i1:78-986(+)
MPALRRPRLLPPLLLLLLLRRACGALPMPTAEVAPGVHMPVLSIGTGGLERSSAAAIVANWLALGGRGIDTALLYGDQAVVPEQLQRAKIDRRDVFITTKIPSCMGATAAAVEYDLKQLRTDYIDLMLLHSPVGDCSKAWPVLEDYHRRGVLRAIGVSNFNRTQLEALLATATVVPAVHQLELNILEYDAEVIQFARSRNITTEAYSPLGRGNHSGDIAGNAAISVIAKSHNVSNYQVALRWILQHGHVLTFQSTSRAHQASDADVFGFKLSDAEMRSLDALRGGTAEQFATTADNSREFVV